jgi:hypothetical protein
MLKGYIDNYASLLSARERIGPPPCDYCHDYARCAAEHLACKSFACYCLAPRTRCEGIGPSRAIYKALFPDR